MFMRALPSSASRSCVTAIFSGHDHYYERGFSESGIPYVITGGGGATLEKVTEAFRIILEDPKVKAILVNIFGGIMRCDVIAEGVVAAARDLGLSVPLVVRLEGTNVDQGRKILAESGIALTVASDMTDAAKKVVAAAKGN